ncbi:ABC transporter ATP-binding protein [Staphylococcus canis]|uniref:ABC transporter ATP-binding protein n=1 Tax=Staphylococcus canis TaxID=2724942 RepID=A0ABS0T7J6_9STAP|nr:ABC transporter ATP-binding protein [Staphylococcus canis]MBI5974715.1 ABC transporter ATP-binding protein [Staphylococcus canis]
MSSAIVLKMINVTHYYRNQKKHNVLKPFSYQPEDIELNNITLHIYQGEALGIIGEPESSKSLVGEILAGTVQPDKGRVVRTGSLFYANMNQKNVENIKVMDYINDVIQLYTYAVPEHKASQILKYAHLEGYENNNINELDDAQYAQLLFSLARSSQAEIVILSHVLTYLNPEFFEKAKEMSKDYIDNGLTWIAIDNHIDRIEAVSNYIAWISHGQLRHEGALKQVIPTFKVHERDRSTLKNDDEKKHFDEDWKRSRSKMPELTYNFKRTERYHHAEPPAFLSRIWTLTGLFIVGMLLFAILIFADLGKIAPSQTSSNTLAQQSKDPYIEKLAYGIVNRNQTQLNGEDNKVKDIKVPRYGFVTITGENKTRYQVEINHQKYTVSKEDLKYFDPAALYESVDQKELEPFLNQNYLSSIEYFNGELNHKHSEVNDKLVPEKENRFVESIVEQPIAMIFDDQEKLKGFVFPIEQPSKLKEKFHIKEDYWIAKAENGYFIADIKHSKWLYIEL